MREVTAYDFIMPEFRGADPKDYEFRADGKIVRKDRWETAMRTITCIVGAGGHDFELEDIVEAVRALVPDVREFDEEGG